MAAINEAKREDSNGWGLISILTIRYGEGENRVVSVTPKLEIYLKTIRGGEEDGDYLPSKGGKTENLAFHVARLGNKEAEGEKKKEKRSGRGGTDWVS